MKVLLLAPHPFYQERGTPIAVDLLLRSFVRRGMSVDMLTYHEGEDRDYGTKVAIRRIPFPGVRGIRPGFSLKKLVCDVSFYREAGRMVRNGNYSIIHAVEESVFMARRFRRRHGLPYVYDMDSSMPRQIADRHPLLRPLLPIMHSCESAALRDALVVVPMCDELAGTARNAGANEVRVLRDISLLNRSASSVQTNLRRDLRIAGTMFLYLGNLEPYQGIDLLLRSFALAREQIPDAVVVVAGGRETDISRYKAVTAQLGLSGSVHFTGPRPVAEMASLFAEADVLLSPRVQGGNTPMKVYSYLDSGKAVLATRLSTHTQVMDDSIALLADPDPASFAAGMVRLGKDPSLRAKLGQAAHRLAQEYYSPAAYERAFDSLYDWIAQKLA